MRLKQTGVIFDAAAAPPDRHANAFTSLVRLHDGTCLAAFRTASGRDASDGRLCIMKCRGDLHDWQTVHPGLTVSVDGIPGNIYAGYFTELEPGRLLGGFLWVDRSNSELSFVHPQTAGILPTKTLLAESTDEGQTWSTFREINLSPETGCSITGPVFPMDSSILALPYETWKAHEDTNPGRHTASLRLSSDNGRTWSERVIVAADPDGRNFYWDQRIARHPQSGRLVAMFWTHDREKGSDIQNHIAWSDSHGKEWSQPISTGWRGQHCQPLSLGGDRLAAIYVHRHDPPSLRVVCSEDFGRIWDIDEEITFYERPPASYAADSRRRSFEQFWQEMMQWQFGHPRAVLRPEGDILIAYYGGDKSATSVLWSLVEL